MKKMKKLLAVISAFCLIMTQVTGLNVFASYNWTEVYADFESLELSESLTSGADLGGVLFFSTPDAETTGAVVNDPAGSDSKVVYFNNTSSYATNRFIGMYYGYFKGFKSVVSFKVYFPNENPKFRIWHDGEIGDGKNELFATVTGGNEKIDARSYGQTLRYPADHEKAGEVYVPPVGEWAEVVVVIDHSTAGKIYAETWIDGVCMLPNTLVHEGDFAANSYSKQIRMMAFNGGFYLDDYEDRIATLNILKTAPTASIDDSHTGDAVAVSATTATINYASETKRLMDINTYADAVSITRGAFELTEGVDYTITNKTHTSFDIEFADSLKYGSEYTINVSDAAQNLVGVSASPATFTFTTEANPNVGNEAPEVVCNGLTDGMRYDIGADAKIEVIADDADGIAEIGLMVNDELVDFAESSNAEFTLENLEEGTYTVYAYAIDASEEALTTNTESVDIIVCENTDTEISLSVADGEIIRIGGQKEFAASAYDADGEAISDVVLTLDGAALASPLTVPTVGIHTLVASVTDSNGNEYTKTANFEYRPEYFASGAPVLWDYSESVPALTGADSLKGELAVIDEAHSTSYVVTASEDTLGNVKAADDLYSNYHDGLYEEFEFYVDNVNAFMVNLPYGKNASQCVYFENGKLMDLDTGFVYATYEANKWYKVRVLFDTVNGKTFVDFNGVNLEFDTNKTGVIRPNYFNVFRVKEGYDGAKAAVDNIKLQYICKYNTLKNVKATDSANVTSTAGAFLPTDTKSLELVFDLPIKDWCCHNDLMKLYKNSVADENEIACTVATGEVWKKGSYTCYRSAILTPSATLEEGQKYIVVIKPGISATMVYGTTYSSSFWSSLVGYEFDFVATSGLKFDSVTVVDDGNTIEKIADITSGTAIGSLAVSNYADTDATVDLIIASYNGNVLSDIKLTTQTVTAGNTATVTTEAVDVSDADCVKVFVWNGANDNAVPYAPAKVIR